MTGPTIAVHHVRAVLGGARRAGLDTVPLLQAAGISPLLLGDDRARVAADRFARLVKELHRATDDEFLGLGPRPSRRGTFAMMGLACVGCPDLGTALERAVRFYGLFPGGPEMAVTMPGRNGEPRIPDRDDRDIRDASPARPAEFSLLSDLRPYPEGTFLAESVLIIWHGGRPPTC
ncbi:AraC family transcriptional regulator ligand-binding domain-containing protein [Streptomyces capuensis]|uniref:AraC family transcriptional regulator ligand-binding domain-containing protein n=1 Tax=Streptomyces capuensis TaxID=1464056 RepID=UPI0007C48DEC|nr:AraC family transcriptional regulator ligand-binding domain-containing protein [Streptomyces capuensis]